MKKYYDSASNEIPTYEPFTLQDVSFPANWLTYASPEDLVSRGISVVELTDPIPQVSAVTPRQARLALNAAGLLSSVTTLIAQSDAATQITWDYATTIERNSPLITSLGSALSLSSEKIDELFRIAATL